LRYWILVLAVNVAYRDFGERLFRSYVVFVTAASSVVRSWLVIALTFL